MFWGNRSCCGQRIIARENSLRRTGFLVLALMLLFPMLSTAQEGGGGEDLLRQVLYLDFHARLLSGSGELLWEMENKAYTISGRTVDIRLEGGNVLAISHLTPYLQGEDKVLLVAQGEVWYNRNRPRDVKYYSGMTSIPIALGESAIFFPLGLNEKTEKTAYIIEIEITVDRYTQLQKNR